MYSDKTIAITNTNEEWVHLCSMLMAGKIFAANEFSKNICHRLIVQIMKHLDNADQKFLSDYYSDLLNACRNGSTNVDLIKIGSAGISESMNR